VQVVAAAPKTLLVTAPARASPGGGVGIRAAGAMLDRAARLSAECVRSYGATEVFPPETPTSL